MVEEGAVFRWNYLFWVTAILLAASFVFMETKGYPLAETDSQWFLPPAISLKSGDGLYNRIHIQSFRFDKKNARRFVWYTPGFPRTVAALMWKPTARCAFTVIAMMNAASLLLTAWLLQWLFSQNGKVFGRSAFIWSTLGLLAASTYLVNARIGRPDYLATLIVMGLVFITLHPRLDLWREILNAVLLAWLAFSHPVASMFAFSILGMAYTILPFKYGIAKVIFTGALSVVLFFIFMYLFGAFGIIENIKGILFHAQTTMCGEVHSPDFIKFWIIHTYATGYGILFMMASTVVIIWICHHSITTLRKVIAAGFILFFFFLMHRFVQISWDRTYNLWVFTPIYVVLFLVPIAEGWFEGKVQKIFHRISAILLIGFSIGYLHTLIIFPYYLSCEKKYDVALIKMRNFYNAHQGEIAVSKSLWPLVDASSYSRTLTFSPTDVHTYASIAQPDWIIMQERYYFHRTPPVIEGYTLLKDDFSSKPLKLFGLIPLIPSSPAYHWAVYKQNN